LGESNDRQTQQPTGKKCGSAQSVHGTGNRSRRGRSRVKVGYAGGGLV
jgi:hypothetical protein